MKGDSFKTCRICGKKIGIITRGIYRKVIVDAEAVEVIADPEGEEFIRVDGSKVRGKEIDPEKAFAMTRGTSKNWVEYAYRPHSKTCGVDE